ncbi:acyltransferase family protein [Pseudonocardia sp. TRM90224]|uniref:acyltransferase family protein n=1 Tax=Pseudonocardia sp. TRM90224 TaxID=2812678 RepID=UPI0035A96DDF
MRALAVSLVVVYHVWFGRVSGGVDVFFLITGFLLTGQLAREAETGTIRLARRWIRTGLRLLPAALTVLLATTVAAALILPEGRWTQSVREIVAAALFMENWQLAADSVDYAARNNALSVVQHFWSLSIQGQFTLVWPLLVALIALVARGGAARLHTNLTLALLGVFASSLTLSIAMTETNQPLAYFNSLTRLWEFALGGLVALWIDRVVLTNRERLLAGWVGVVGLVACGAVLQVSTAFPGYAALWPTVCAALVLVAGNSRRRFGADRLLSSRPAQYLGGLGFALYLWHWPVLVLFLAGTGVEDAGLAGGILVIAVSLVLAVLTHHGVEMPVLARSFGVANGLRLCACGLVAVLIAATIWQVAAAHRAVPDGRSGDNSHPGALALGEAVQEAPLLPPPVSVYDDWVDVEHWNCGQMPTFAADVCTQPVADPDRRIVVVGDSHMQQFLATLLPIAEHRNWQLTLMVRGACPFSTASEVLPEDAECVEWNTAALAEIAAMRPDAVVTLASRDARTGLTEQTPPGFVEQWRRLDELHIPVMAVRDNPRFESSVPDCVARHERRDPACNMERSTVYASTPPYLLLPDVPRNVRFVDIAGAVCDATVCPAEVGNLLVYLDDNHLTAAYATTMAKPLEQQVLDALGW